MGRGEAEKEEEKGEDVWQLADETSGWLRASQQEAPSILGPRGSCPAAALLLPWNGHGPAC